MKNKGFSLIEVAIALIVAGLVTAPMIGAYHIYKMNKQITQSSSYLQVIDKAMRQYVNEKGRYPLPAVRNLTETNPLYGKPYPNTPASLAAMPNCSSTGGDVNVCKTPSPGVAGQVIYIGDVPFAALGLPKMFFRDGYGSKFTYAVSARLTNAATFTQNGGVIRVVERDGGPAQGSQISSVDAVHYAVVSHGADRVGGFSLFGALPLACTGAGKDRENCDNDGTFNNNFAILDPANPSSYARFAVMPAGADHYDDYLIFATSSGGGIWSMVTSASTNISTSTGGNVLIGSASASPVAKLDVRAYTPSLPGNVQADQLITDRLCSPGALETDGCIAAGAAPGPSPYKENVFDPGIIGGDPYVTTGLDMYNNPIEIADYNGGGIHCGSRPLNGIVNADESCGTVPPGFNIGPSCATGLKARATDGAGQLICVLP